jgi:SMI1 / KNR4 family (SUKH-1)
MGATAENIWRVPAYLPYIQPPLTKRAITAAEKKLGYSLPSELLELLKKQNGGYLRYSLPESPHGVIAGIGPYFPSLTKFDWEEDQEHVSYTLEGLVPFDGDGHWHLCLDYRKNSTTPAVTYADVECDRETKIASSFADYLGMLKLSVENEYVLESVSNIDVVIAALSSLLKVTFEPPSSWAHGYPTYRAQVRKKGPEWLWISPNTVPRGFVRKDHGRYAQLVALLPGEAPRFPELPADSYIFSATAAVRKKALAACAKAKLVVRPLREYVTV